MYLADDSQGSVLDRHQILSVNEVLRDGKPARDRQRVRWTTLHVADDTSRCSGSLIQTLACWLARSNRLTKLYRDLSSHLYQVWCTCSRSMVRITLKAFYLATPLVLTSASRPLPNIGRSYRQTLSTYRHCSSLLLRSSKEPLPSFRPDLKMRQGRLGACLKTLWSRCFCPSWTKRSLPLSSKLSLVSRIECREVRA